MNVEQAINAAKEAEEAGLCGLYPMAAQTLADEVKILREAILETLEENGHLADGDNCTLIKLKLAMPNADLSGRTRSA